MAQRFGGKYSPDAPQSGATNSAQSSLAPASAGGHPGKTGARAAVMFFLPLLFLGPLLGGSPDRLILSLVAAGLMLAAALLTREGIKAHLAYDARKVARRPAFPRKIVGSVFAGLSLGVGTAVWATGPLYPLFFGLIGAALHLGSFGLDPMADKGAEGIDQFQTDRVARAVDEAEAHLKGMSDAILRAGDQQMERRVETFAAAARGLFRSVENDPGDLTAARKFLSVYLMGARDATVKFADLYAQNRDAKARADYEALLTDLETNFAARTKALLANNHNDLDIEIAVLRDRLKLET